MRIKGYKVFSRSGKEKRVARAKKELGLGINFHGGGIAFFRYGLGEIIAGTGI
jgi:hypothetical protein